MNNERYSIYSRNGVWYRYDSVTRTSDRFASEEDAGFAAFCANHPERDI